MRHNSNGFQREPFHIIVAKKILNHLVNNLADKKITFSKLADNAYAYTAEGDPNTGIVICPMFARALGVNPDGEE